MGSNGLAASDVIRSMMHAGFSRDEIYDVLTGIGLYGEQVQLLIDRVAAEFHEAGLESRPSRLTTEVKGVFEEAFGELQHVMFARMDSLARQLELVKTELENLGRRVVELGTVVSQAFRGKCLNRKSHKLKVGKIKGGKIGENRSKGG